MIQALHCDVGLMARWRYELTDGEWSIIEPLLPNKPRGVPRVGDRRVLNGILWRFRIGSPWAAIPERHGPSMTCYNRFVRWRKAGVWDRLPLAVSAGFEGEIVMIASTCVRVHQHGAAGKRGDPVIAAWDVPEAASRAKSMPSLTLMVVPSRSNRKQRYAFSGWLYRQCNLVERFFNRIKHFRGIATRQDTRPENYLAAVKC